MKNRKWIKVLLVLLAVVTAGVIFSCSANKPSEDGSHAVITEDETETALQEDETGTQETTEGICVHVCGSVAAPGVYYLSVGSRVHEAVEKAGGLKEDAAAE